MKRFGSFAAFVVAACLVSPVVHAHTILVTPTPRDDIPHKSDGPCGSAPRTQVVEYAVGAKISVTWVETVDHSGCFQVGYTTNDQGLDQNFKLLYQEPDPAGDVVPKSRTRTIQLPAGVECPYCTLTVRQIMDGQPCPNLPVGGTMPAPQPSGTYYSCADVRFGDFPDAGLVPPQPPKSDGGTTSSSSGGSSGTSSSGMSSGESSGMTSSGDTTTDGDGGSMHHASSYDVNPSDGGCSMSGGEVAGASGMVVMLLSLIRRRQRRA
jgi:hypothetical protein